MAGTAVRNLEPYYDEKLKNGNAIGTVAGIAEQLSKFPIPCYEVLIQATRTNTQRIYIGGPGVTNLDNGGIYLLPGQTITISAQNLQDVYINSVVNLESVTYIYW